jgi:hypothetical protein
MKQQNLKLKMRCSRCNQNGLYSMDGDLCLTASGGTERKIYGKQKCVRCELRRDK